MSFRCQKCMKAQPSGTTPHKHVAKTRQRQYANTSSVGSEIMKELNLCQLCYLQVQKKLKVKASA